MQRTCLDIASISRYLNSLAEIEDVLRVERHVERCARCRDKLIRMKRYSEALFDDLVTTDGPNAGGCPSHIQLQHFLRGNLNERQMVRVQEHLRSCARCRVDVLASTWTQSPGADLEHALFATRRPDLDLRVAPQGIRIAAGGALLDDAMLPTLLRRLELQHLAPAVPEVTTTRQLSFAQPVGPHLLRGRIELAGYEDFHLELQPLRDPDLEALQLWTRERSVRRFAADRRFRELLGPGHYFVGPTPYEPPWLAVSVEQDFLTARGLVECAYDACCRGHFHSAQRRFEDAVQLAPEVRAYRTVLASVSEFARRFGLDGDDVPVRWRTRRARPRRGDDPQSVDVGNAESGIESIARLVLALRREVDKRDGEHDPLAEGRFVSRHEFRSAFAALLRDVTSHIGRVSTSGAAPGSSR